MKSYCQMILIFIVLSSYSCERESDVTNPIKKSILKGFVQKGPFLNGTSITISELDSGFEQTGKVYITQIDNSIGSFSISNINLSSQYVILQATGFYYNEIIGDNSAAQLTLSTITDLRDSSTININILSTLERKRVEYLISGGKSFSESKSQAREEILKIFSITKPEMTSPEFLDISKEGDDNAILLAISSIMQGYRTESDLAELTANISEDIKADGILSDSLLGTSIINHAKVLEKDKIRQNLLNKYKSLNTQVIIPDFEKYIDNFVDSTTFLYTDLVEFPDSGKSGYNLMSYNQFDYSQQVQIYPSSEEYKLSLAALVPKLATIKVRVKFKNPGTWTIDSRNSGWIIDSNWESNPNVFIFTKDYSREYLDMKVNLFDTGSASIEIFENNMETPVRTKEINW